MVRLIRLDKILFIFILLFNSSVFAQTVQTFKTDEEVPKEWLQSILKPIKLPKSTGIKDYYHCHIFWAVDVNVLKLPDGRFHVENKNYPNQTVELAIGQGCLFALPISTVFDMEWAGK
jgi:hypothetical protein